MENLRFLFLAIWEEFQVLVRIDIQSWLTDPQIDKLEKSDLTDGKTQYKGDDVGRLEIPPSPHPQHYCPRPNENNAPNNGRFYPNIRKYSELVYFWASVAVLLMLSCQIRVSENQLGEMQKEKRIDARPWVLASRYIDTNYQGMECLCVFYHNVGKTPALNVQSVYGSIANLNDLLPGGGIHISENDQVSAMLAPTGGDDYSANVPILPGFISIVTNGGSFFMFCQVAYDDVFGIHHWTRSTWEMQRTGSSTIGISTFPRKGNDCDTNN